MKLTERTRWNAGLLTASILAFAATVSAQEPKAHEISANDLVRLAVANEVAAADKPKEQHLFRSDKQTPKGSQTKLYVETDDALAAITIAYNGQPLSQEQQQAEQGHLGWLMSNPDQLHKKHAREKEDTDRTLRILKALPDAFYYEYDGKEMGATGLGEPGDKIVKLKFTPNPSYSPPTRVEQVLAGMQGHLLIDSRLRRIAEIDGTLFRDVSFGWGIIGRLDKGGHFLVRQGDLGLGDGEWGITEMNLDVTGKILLVKGLSMIEDEKLSDFQVAGKNLTFAQGVELLKTQQEKLAHNAHTEPSPTEAHKTEEKTPHHR